MDRTLYLECNSGISGDMTVAALLDLGADAEVLKNVLDTIPVHGFKVEYSRLKKSGIDCMDFNVVLDEEHENHDHDMEYLHGKDETVREHSHEHKHTHEHRSLLDVMDILNHVQMSQRARATANRIFQIIAEAEAKAHAIPMEQVHFHEVGAIDSIVDIVAVAVCMDNLNIDQVIVPKLCEGSGTIRCQHGILPIPVPAVANIVNAYEIPLELSDVKGELVTPTGAAVVAALRTGNVLPKEMIIDKIGMGAGKRNYECPSILRAMLIHEKKDDGSGDEETVS